jgi:hypothetical protein
MNATNTSLAQKREAIEKNKAVKQALPRQDARNHLRGARSASLSGSLRALQQVQHFTGRQEQRSAHRNVSRHYRKSAPICLALLKNIMSLLEAKRFLQHQAHASGFGLV